MLANGGTLRRTFVAEVGSKAGQYLCRAKCTRCLPAWVGPVRRLTDEVARHGGAIDPGDAVKHTQAAALRDVLAHIDRRHGGRLS